MKRNKRFILKTVALTLAVNFLSQAFLPAVAYALTAGPSSPEFASFEPVATTDMVNDFSGDLTYNLPVISIPGPDGAGYAMSLSYHSGNNVEEEASWVGYGWTLNPGAINRNVRGFPDDYKNVNVKHYNKTIPNWTVVAKDQVSLELFSNSEGSGESQQEEKSPIPISPSLSHTLRYNNYQGFNRTMGVGVNYGGVASLNANFATSGITFSASLSVGQLLNKLLKKQKEETTTEKKEVDATQVTAKDAFNKSSNFTLKNSLKHSLKLKSIMKRVKRGVLSSANASTYGIMAFESFKSAPTVADYKGFGFNYNNSFELNPAQAPVGIEKGFMGSFNMQYNVPVTDYSAYGYANNLNKGDFDEKTDLTLNDYYVEKESTFDQRDLFIGIPFPNYDIFALSGEGLSGSFRNYNLSTGQYYPNFITSDITNLNIGFELMVGVNIGVGVNLGVGNNKFRLKDWGNAGNSDLVQYDKSAGSVYRFNKDMGGKVQYAKDNEVDNAKLEVNPDFPMIKGAHPAIDTGRIHSYLNDGNDATEAKQRSGRSSFISSEKEGDVTTGFEITKEDGSRYRYGQPVYAKNEVQVSVDVDDTHEIVDHKKVYRQTPLSSNGFDEAQMNQFHSVLGEAKLGEQAKYATNYLISEITTADYVDLTGDGPTKDDFGGWTSFEYEKIHDDYRWKVPYTGMNYAVNQISNKKDDMGSVSTGEKEVHLLRRVKTKTHTAYFITNKSNAGYENEKYQPSGIDRKDGLSASVDTEDKYAKGADKMEHLEKIVLVANERKETPIKVVNFDYRYELVPNVPNNIHGEFPASTSSNESGKLTLKKVWFEYEGIVNAKISPYEFHYVYKDKADYPQELKEKYPHMDDFFQLSDKYRYETQNPSYNSYSMDPWGYNQPMGKEQAERMRNWRYQGELPMGEEYDPAAYQLKQIRLPSGGEILIEYEEKDYRYVQDRSVMAMVSLKDFDDNENGVFGGNKYSKEPWYDLNLEDAGLTATQGLLDTLRTYFLVDSNRIYFKHLFQLKGENLPSLSDCRSEYIDGYAKVKDVELVGGNIRVTIDGEGSGHDEPDNNYPMTPRQACYDFYSTQRVGKYKNPFAECETDFDSKNNKVEDLAYNGNENIVDDVVTFIEKMGFAIGMISSLHSKVLDPSIDFPVKSTVCKTLNKELSYLKIPVSIAKKGGGCRVKRLLTYDPGIESGESGALYGSAYYYEDENGASSGVATNEPSQMREENPLVGFIPKKEQSWFSRHTVGKDKEQTEGPIGESLLPPASVGHSRVVIENVHKGASGNGFAIHSFHTVRDYPYDKTYSYRNENKAGKRKYEFEKAFGVDYSVLGDNMAKDNAPINAGLFSYNSKKFWATQGFRFIQNSMHGQPKSVEKYSHTYDDYKNNRSNVYLVFAQEYDYFQPGEKQRVLKQNPETGDIEVEWDTPGKEMDLAMEMKSVKERSLDFKLEVDISIGLSAPPPPFLTMMPSFAFGENILSLHSTSKVINYPAIQRAVRVFQDGIWTETEYLAFDGPTGQPLVTRTVDLYDGIKPNCEPHEGSIYSTILPAHWYYAEMGSMSAADGTSDYRTNQLTASAGSLTTYGENGNPIKSDGQEEYFEIPVTGVLDAKAKTYSKGELKPEWFDAGVVTAYDIENDALAKLKKIYRSDKQYTYKTAVTSIIDHPVYNAGVYNSFNPFDFTSDQQVEEWVKMNEVTKYSPNGMPVEEKNVLGIPSSARFGYAKTMPIAVGSNCEYGTLYFEHYENRDNDDDDDISDYAHSGKHSLQLTAPSTTVVPAVELTDKLLEKGAIVRAWIKSDEPLNRSLELTISGSELRAPAVKIARTGEWELIHFDLSSEMLSEVSSDYTQVYLNYDLIGQDIYIDDVRFQPFESEVTCFVYDPATLRLVTQFDDQHFGVYYQYNNEGKLVRKVLETERGNKTVQESLYNTPKLLR